MKRLLNYLAASLLLAVPVATHAQALPAATGPGSNVVVGGGLSYFQQDYGHRHIAGGFTYIDLNATWRYALEGEVRQLKLNTSQQVTQSTYLGGIKVNLTRRPARITPFAKALCGAGRITLPYKYAHGDFFTCAAGGGVEYEVGDRLSLRLIDAEVQRWKSFPFGHLQPYGISAGISFRITGVPRFPDGRRGAR